MVFLIDLGIILISKAFNNFLMFKFHESKLIGEILQQADLVSKAQVEVALHDQKRHHNLGLGHLKIGDIFALRGWFKQETTDFFVQRWDTLLTQEDKKPLGYYLRAAALLDEQQINYLLQEQQSSKMRLRLGELAYLQGWVKLKTVDYFVKNLSSKLSGTNELTIHYSSLVQQILQQYINGETNFQGLQLKKVTISHANIRGINLSDSDLEGAVLKEVNLDYSSLRQVNLKKANLEKASLKETDLSNSCLKQANLNQACLERADLRNANLRDSNLAEASFLKASLEGADLRGANLQGTTFDLASCDAKTYFDSDFDPFQEKMQFSLTENVPSKIILL